jgi:hypothetical protein
MPRNAIKGKVEAIGGARLRDGRGWRTPPAR